MGGGRGRVAVLVAVEGATVAANVGVGEGDFCGAGVLGALSGVAEARVDVAVARGSGDGRVVALAVGVKEGEETTGGDGGDAVGCPCLLCHNVFASNPKITQPARMPELNKTVSRVVSRNLRASFIENPPPLKLTPILRYSFFTQQTHHRIVRQGKFERFRTNGGAVDDHVTANQAVFDAAANVANLTPAQHN